MECRALLSTKGSTTKTDAPTFEVILQLMTPICISKITGLPSSRKTTNLLIRYEDEDEALKQCATEDTADINKKIVEESADPYDILVGEFEPCGEVVKHIVTSGKTNVGAVTEKQEWSKLQFVFLFHSLAVLTDYLLCIKNTSTPNTSSRGIFRQIRRNSIVPNFGRSPERSLSARTLDSFV